MKSVSFFVPGIPKAQPRARSFILRGKGGMPIIGRNGQPILRVHEAGSAEAWKQAVAVAAREHLPMPPIQGPVSLSIEFIFPRPKSHFKSQSAAAMAAGASMLLKDSAPFWHVNKPDRDNCEKAVTDALKVLGMFCDDSQICCGEVTKTYQTQGQPTPGAQITIQELDSAMLKRVSQKQFALPL